MPTTLTLLALAALAAAVALVCWVADGGVRRVPAGRRVVVVGTGAVRRVHGGGLAWRLPLVERFVEDGDGVREVPVAVRATTGDGLAVLVLAQVRASAAPPVPGTACADPWPAVERATQRAVAGPAARWQVGDLAHWPADLGPMLRRAVAEEVRDLGVDVAAVDLVEVDVLLEERPAPAARPGS